MIKDGEEEEKVFKFFLRSFRLYLNHLKHNGAGVFLGEKTLSSLSSHLYNLQCVTLYSQHK